MQFIHFMDNCYNLFKLSDIADNEKSSGWSLEVVLPIGLLVLIVLPILVVLAYELISSVFTHVEHS